MPDSRPGLDVLVVEDDDAMAGAIVRNVRVRGYTAQAGNSVASARELLAVFHPTLLVLDINLPDGAGWDVLRSIDVVARRRMSVVVISALRPNPRLVADHGCEAAFEKPFPIDSLMRRVLSILIASRDADATQESIS